MKRASTDNFSYFEFFNRFRSPPDIVKKHQSIFLRFFNGCKNVLDIGCGRGEFLELLTESGIGCEGVDFNGEMVEHCRKKGLNVRQADAISYLEDMSDVEKRMAETYNHNIERLNKTIYGPENYAAIAKK